MHLSELRLGLRRLIRRPVFAVSTLALIGCTLGIAVTAGSVAEATLWRSLPYADEDRLVALYWSREDLGIPDMSLSLVEARELTGRTSAFEGVAATQTPIHVTLVADEGPAHLTAGLVMPEAFELLGVQPLLGRGFDAEEGENGTSSSAVVLGHAAWQRLFGGSPSALRAALVINGREWTVVGVLPPRRSLAPEQSEPIDVWFPMGVAEEFMGEGVFTAPTANSFRANARLREGTAADALPAELERVAEALARDYPATHAGWRFRADPLRDRVLGSSSGPVIALFLGAVLFCGVAVLNLASLLYQRSEGDALDIAIRRAVGATGARIRALRATDALVSGVLAAAVATALTFTGFAVVNQSSLLQLPEHVTLAFGWPHLLALITLSVGGTLVVGALAGAASDARGVDRLTAASASAAAPRRRARSTLLALWLQVTLSTSLTVGAIATLRSLDELHDMGAGVDAAGVLTARANVPRDLFTTDEVARRARELVEQARDLPDVRDAFVWSPELPTDAHMFTRLRVEALAEVDDSAPLLARYHTVSPGAVGALGLRLIAGRDMSDDDFTGGRRVVMVSASAAERWWGAAEAALGQRIRRSSHTEWSDVIGVVADAPLSGRFGPGSDNTLDVFFMFDQDPRSTFLVFVASERERVDVEELRATSASVLPGVPLYDVRSMADALRDQERGHRSTATLSGIYAIASLLLASIGLAGSTMLLLGRRRAEVGIRLALGATRPRVVVELMQGSLLAIGTGILAGVPLARAGLGLLDPVILRVGPDDLLSHLGAALTLGGCAVLSVVAASLTSVRRDPVRSLIDSRGRF